MRNEIKYGLLKNWENSNLCLLHVSEDADKALHGYREIFILGNSKLPWLHLEGREKRKNCGGVLPVVQGYVVAGGRLVSWTSLGSNVGL